MFLNYLALIILLAGVTLVFYLFIFIHDLPYEQAIKRNHPHKEAIHYACWLSLFTLHAIWPIVFIWAVMGHPPTEVKIADKEAKALADRMAALEAKLATIESKAGEQKS